MDGSLACKKEKFCLSILLLDFKTTSKECPISPSRDVVHFNSARRCSWFRYFFISVVWSSQSLSEVWEISLHRIEREVEIKLSLETDLKGSSPLWHFLYCRDQRRQSRTFMIWCCISMSNTAVHSVRLQHFPPLHCQGAKVSSVHSGEKIDWKLCINKDLHIRNLP